MYHTGIEAPQGVWWKPVHKAEKIWVSIAFAWCLVLFAMMPFWHLRGGQNPSGIRHRVDPNAFRARVTEFIGQYQVGTDQGLPVVAPPPGSDIYLQAQMWSWMPLLQLEEGAEYTLHLSALYVNHGFNLYPLSINFQVILGYDYGLRIVPNQAGDYRVVCNEFCGIGHHTMRDEWTHGYACFHRNIYAQPNTYYYTNADHHHDPLAGADRHPASGRCPHPASRRCPIHLSW